MFKFKVKLTAANNLFSIFKACYVRLFGRHWMVADETKNGRTEIYRFPFAPA